MNIKKLLICTLLLILSAVCFAFFYFKGKEYTILLDQETVQKKINEKSPFKKKYAFILVFKAKDTEVQFKEGSDRIKVSTKIELNIKIAKISKNLGATIESEMGIKYDQENFSFHLIDPELQQLKIQGVPENYTDLVTEMTSKYIQDYFNNLPVYKIKETNMKTKLAKAVLKDVKVENEKLKIVLGY